MTEAKSAPTKRRRPQQRALKTRKKIIDAAVMEFARHGVEGASTRAIAERAGVRQSLVIHHFGTKEELWRETLRETNQDRRDKLVARLRGLRGVDDTTKLKLVLEDFVRFSAEHPEFHELMAHAAKEKGERLSWIVEDYLQHTFDSTADLIRSAQKEGRFIEGDPYHLQYLFIGTATRVFMQSGEAEAIMGESPFSPEFLERHVQYCLGLFFKDPEHTH